MIIALILADQTAPLIRNSLPYLLPVGDESVIERVARVVLRGPFGATVIASPASSAKELKSALNGFVVQYATLPIAGPGTMASLTAALKFSEEFRARWEKARAAAAQRFNADDDDEDDEEEEDDDDEGGAAPSKSPGKSRTTSSKSQPASKDTRAEWSKHSANADVKVRGLARSFERDGVMLFRGESPLLRPELQAQMVESFAREAQQKGPKARPFAQAVHAGARGFPVLIDRAAIAEVMALPPSVVFDDWLLDQLTRVQDVQLQEGAALERIRNEEDYAALLKTL